VFSQWARATSHSVRAGALCEHLNCLNERLAIQEILDDSRQPLWAMLTHCGPLRRGADGRKRERHLTKDLTRRRFGRWHVLRHAGRNKWRKAMWLCRCDCGTERAVIGASLLTGRSLSCDCASAKELAGRRFGWLVVLERAGSNKGALWLCRCNCGTEKVIRAHNLVRGMTSSCGCRRGRPPKITMSQARAIRRARGRQVDIAQQYGISRSLVSQIKCGERWVS
jgi:hypothetical protein